MLKLTRNLNTLDCESNGLDVQKDRIITLAIVQTRPDGAVVCDDWMFNPGVPILNSDIHGITDEMVKDCPKFDADHARKILNVLAGGDIAGFNVLGFDVQILWEEFWRVGVDWDLSGVSIVDAGTIFKLKEERTLTAAVKFYCGNDHAGAHGAMADAKATLEVLQAQVARYGDISELPVTALAQLCATDRDGGVRLDLAGTLVRGRDGVVRYTHKKVRGVAVSEDAGYAGWMLRSDFSEQTKRVIRSVLAEIEAKGQGEMF